MSEIKLSKRMQAVADMVSGDYVADIGCDHAFVSAYLVQTGRARKVIAMDVKKGPVNIAKDNIATYGLVNQIEVRLSDGFDKLEVGEADCAVIAGMGGPLMVRILQNGIRHLEHGIKLVLQPQSDIGLVRSFLLECGYCIVDENMLIDEGKYYTVIKAESIGQREVLYSEEELLYGPILLEKQDVILKDYLLKQEQTNLQIIANLEKVCTKKSNNRIDEINMQNKVIKKALQKYT